MTPVLSDNKIFLFVLLLPLVIILGCGGESVFDVCVERFKSQEEKRRQWRDGRSRVLFLEGISIILNYNDGAWLLVLREDFILVCSWAAALSKESAEALI